MSKPLIAVTMGDPTGIGPEIIANALSRPEITCRCRMLVIGDVGAMERGIATAGAQLRVTPLSHGLPPAEPATGIVYLRPMSRLAC